MIDDLSKLIAPNWSAVEIICCILVFKGIGKMQDLTASIKDLAQILNDTKRHVDLLDTRFVTLEHRVNSLEQFLREEFHTLKFDIEHLRREEKDVPK